MRWLANFYDFRFKSTATAWTRIHPTKAWLSQLCEFQKCNLDFRRTICNKLCFKLGKMPQKPMECFRLLFDHLAWIEHQFLSGIRDSRKAGSLWGMTSGVVGVRKSIHQSWLAKGLGLGLLCWGFKGVQQEIYSEEASTLQIRSVAFPPGQCTSHNSILVTHYLTKMGIKTVPRPPYSPDLASCDFCLFPKLRGCRYETIEEMKEAVTKIIDTHTQEDFHGAFQKLLERYNKCIVARGLLRREIEFHVCTINKSAHTKKVWKPI